MPTGDKPGRCCCSSTGKTAVTAVGTALSKIRWENDNWTFRVFLHELSQPGAKFLCWIVG
jgi:hypothetical protein